MNANPTSAAPAAPASTPSTHRAPVRAQSPTTLASFDAYQVALSACSACAGFAPSLDANLRSQMTRAASSVVLNFAEGFGSSSRGVKRRRYEIARGSATECVAVLDLACALGIVSADQIATAHPLFTRICMMLARLQARFA
jgi:four helix bundle protein